MSPSILTSTPNCWQAGVVHSTVFQAQFQAKGLHIATPTASCGLTFLGPTGDLNIDTTGSSCPSPYSNHATSPAPHPYTTPHTPLSEPPSSPHSITFEPPSDPSPYPVGFSPSPPSNHSLSDAKQPVLSKGLTFVSQHPQLTEFQAGHDVEPSPLGIYLW